MGDGNFDAGKRDFLKGAGAAAGAAIARGPLGKMAAAIAGSEAALTVTLASVGTLVLGAVSYDEAEAAPLEKRLDAAAIGEAKVMFDKFVNNPKTIQSLDILNAKPGEGVKWATLPTEVFNEYIKGAANLRDRCGVTGAQIGVEIPSAGQAKIIMKLVTKDPAVFHQFSRPATKR